MSSPRTQHAATLLPDGRVLVSGGDNGGSPTAGAELYRPAIDSWGPAASMNVARAIHTATLLGDGTVLVAGGRGGPGPTETATAATERYSPAHNAWTPGHSMSAVRFAHTATLVGDGLVLVAGGTDRTSILASSELYDAGAGTWAPEADMAISRYAHSSTLLASGTLLVAGGFTFDRMASVEGFSTRRAELLSAPGGGCRDCDRDTYVAPADCDDANAAVHPGAVDKPGNEIDEDCLGGDAATPRLRAGIAFAVRHEGRHTVFTRLVATRLRAGSTVRISCVGSGCRFERAKRVVKPRVVRLDLLRVMRRSRLRPGARVEIRVTKPGTIGVVRMLRIRGAGQRPDVARRCLAPGASRPSFCRG